jgi:hypothetical protein
MMKWVLSLLFYRLCYWKNCFRIKKASSKEIKGQNKHMYHGKEMEAFYWHFDAHDQCPVCKQGLPVLLESIAASVFSGRHADQPI